MKRRRETPPEVSVRLQGASWSDPATKGRTARPPKQRQHLRSETWAEDVFFSVLKDGTTRGSSDI